MKRFKVLAVLLLIMEYSFGKVDGKDVKTHVAPVVCYASEKSHQSFIGSPLYLKSYTGKSANIIVDYVGFPDSARVAFQFAIDIWKNLIYSPFPIHVQANWTSLNKGVLGSSRPSELVKNFDGTQIWDCYYPISLAEKILGKELNQPGDYEIVAQFNKDYINWYFGTDGAAQSNQYDFVSVVLHELAHGLGFTGNLYSSRGRGGYSYLSDNLPATFDLHVENKIGNKLVDKTLFANPSFILNQNLISDQLYFETLLASGYSPRLYAPPTWNSGSSIYHLDESTYDAGDPNSLMTPYSGGGEAIHDPGEYTLNIMYEIGWKSITINHKPVHDMETVTLPINFEAKILSDFDLNQNKIYLIYTSNKFARKDSILLKPTSAANVFSASLPLSQNGTYQYFFSATDSKNRRYLYPSNSPTRALSFKIGVDNELPVVSYDPIKYLLEYDPKTKITANVTDNLGVKSVNLQYFINGGIVQSLVMKNDSDDVYSVNLSFPIGSVKDGDVISYRVVAVDASSNNNIGKSPISGYNTFRIEGFKNPVDKYVNNFDVIATDFISGDFTVETPAGFASPALNSPHPYASPERDNESFDFTTILKYPIILKDGGKISYDEIVLVEPGDSGSKFGEENFFDYVIVEGSKDGGTTWKPLNDGYDSSSQPSWLTLYNSVTDGQNSTATATRDLFVKHEFGLLDNGNFAVNDTILIRFRLYSDPYANGWGWVIDNLAIQDFGTFNSTEILSSGEVEFFPNPTHDRVNVRIQSKKIIPEFLLKVYNSSGNLVMSQLCSLGYNQFSTVIDVGNLAPGLYLFTVEPEKGKLITRKVLIQ